MNILLRIFLCTETDHGYLISRNNMQLFVVLDGLSAGFIWML